MKAMLLAAGYGSRLRPLTHKLPKALVKAGSESLIEHNLTQLSEAGIEDVVINVCHHARQIIDTLGDGKRYGVRICYSYEKDAPLGTGGGILQALPIIGSEPFILISADIWSDFTFPSSFLKHSSPAHLVFVDNPYYHPQGDYALDTTGRVTTKGNPLTYANIAKLHPDLFLGQTPGFFSLSKVLNAAIDQGIVTGEKYEGLWFNVGTLEELERLRKALG